MQKTTVGILLVGIAFVGAVVYVFLIGTGTWPRFSLQSLVGFASICLIAVLGIRFSTSRQIGPEKSGGTKGRRGIRRAF